MVRLSFFFFAFGLGYVINEQNDSYICWTCICIKACNIRGVL